MCESIANVLCASPRVYADMAAARILIVVSGRGEGQHT